MTIEEIIGNLRRTGLTQDRAQHIIDKADQNVLIYYLRLSGYSAAILREQAINTIIEYRKQDQATDKRIVDFMKSGGVIQDPLDPDTVADLQKRFKDKIEQVLDGPVTFEIVEQLKDTQEPMAQPDPELPIPDKVLHDSEPEVFVGVDVGKAEDEVVVVTVQDGKVLPNEPVGWFPPELRDKPVEEPELTVPEVDPLYDVANFPDHKEDLAGWCAGVSKLLEMGAVKHRLAEELGISTTTLNNRLKKNAKTS